MDGYLLDTNHVVPLLRQSHEHRAAILRRLGSVPSDSPVCIATATLAELELGCSRYRNGTQRTERQAELRETIRSNSLRVLDFTSHTAAEYGVLKAALMQKFNRNAQKRAAKFPEVWTSPDKGATLGVDEFDLLMVSHAIERGLVLVTTDQMLRICDGIGAAKQNLNFGNWVSGSE